MKRPPHNFVVAAISARELEENCTDWRRSDVCRAFKGRSKNSGSYRSHVLHVSQLNIS